MKKKKHHSSLDQNFNFETENFVAKKGLGTANSTDTPPYQRKRFFSQSEVPAYDNHKAILKLSDYKSISSSQATVEIDKPISTTACRSVELDNSGISNSSCVLTKQNSHQNSSEKVLNDLQNGGATSDSLNLDVENNHRGTVLIKKQALNTPNQLVYSYHRSLLAAGKMRQQAGKKPVRVHLLNGESILLVFDVSTCD